MGLGYGVAVPELLKAGRKYRLAPTIRHDKQDRISCLWSLVMERNPSSVNCRTPSYGSFQREPLLAKCQNPRRCSRRRSGRPCAQSSRLSCSQNHEPREAGRLLLASWTDGLPECHKSPFSRQTFSAAARPESFRDCADGRAPPVGVRPGTPLRLPAGFSWLEFGAAESRRSRQDLFCRPVHERRRESVCSRVWLAEAFPSRTFASPDDLGQGSNDIQTNSAIVARECRENPEQYSGALAAWL